MNDREFLIWIHDRIHYVYKESLNVDFLHKLRNIILAYSKKKVTPNLIGTLSDKLFKGKYD